MSARAPETRECPPCPTPELSSCACDAYANASEDAAFGHRQLPKPYYSETGITIYHGDARDLLPYLSADFVITDPPYNARKNYGPDTNDNMPWPDWVEWWDGMLRLCRGAAPEVLSFMSQTAYRWYLKLGAQMPDWTLVWSKPLSLAVCALPFMPHWEPIAYWGGARKRDGAFYGGDVLTCNVARGREHPTEKPLPLMRDLVSRFDGLILDPFMGSGTTLLAAKLEGRTAIGIEIDERWCALAASRLSDTPLQRNAQAVLPLELR